MQGNANAAAVKGAASIIRRIAGRGEVTITAGNGEVRFTRTTTGNGYAGYRSAPERVTIATAAVPVDAVVNGCGVLAEDAMRRIAAATGTVTVEMVGDGFRFRSGDAILGTTTRPEVDFPAEAFPAPAMESPLAVMVEPRHDIAAEAVRIMQGVAEAADTSADARAVLSGVAIGDGGAIVATDTYRLHVAERHYVHGPDHAIALVPAHVLRAFPAAKVERFALAAVPAEAEVRDARGPRWGLRVELRYGTRRNPVTVRVEADGPTVEGPFPRWRTLLPVGHDAVRGPVVGTYAITDGMADTLRAVQPSGPTLVRWGDDGTVTFAAMTNVAGTVNLHVPDGAPSATLGTATTGDGEVILNAAYLRSASTFAGAGATLELRDGLRPVAVVGTDRVAVVMPMRAGGR
jgi:hypothetical protein